MGSCRVETVGYAVAAGDEAIDFVAAAAAGAPARPKAASAPEAEKVAIGPHGQLLAHAGSFVEELRASLDDALDIALEQLDASISRLMALERRTLETERRKRADLAKLREILEENVIRVATPAGASPVSPVVTSRARQ